jgi:hypothetical protein
MWDTTPVENALIGSFNGRLRDECLNVYGFESIAHAQAVITAWRDVTITVGPMARLDI